MGCFILRDAVENTESFCALDNHSFSPPVRLLLCLLVFSSRVWEEVETGILLGKRKERFLVSTDLVAMVFVIHKYHG